MHQWQFVEETALSKGFSFHSKLAEWMIQSGANPETIVTVEEIKCNDSNCPISETKISWKPGRELLISKPQHMITKTDFILSAKKQNTKF